MNQRFNLSFTLNKEGESYVAQGVKFDLVAQGETKEEAKDSFLQIVAGQAAIDIENGNIPLADARIKSPIVLGQKALAAIRLDILTYCSEVGSLAYGIDNEIERDLMRIGGVLCQSLPHSWVPDYDPDIEICELCLTNRRVSKNPPSFL